MVFSKFSPNESKKVKCPDCKSQIFRYGHTNKSKISKGSDLVERDVYYCENNVNLQEGHSEDSCHGTCTVFETGLIIVSGEEGSHEFNV